VKRYIAVIREPGPAWDPGRAMREQNDWAEHAAFMDGLAAEGVIVLGGPVGAGDGDYALLVVDAESEAAIRALLAADPWEDTILRTASIEPWAVWLQRGRG